MLGSRKLRLKIRKIDIDEDFLDQYKDTLTPEQQEEYRLIYEKNPTPPYSKIIKKKLLDQIRENIPKLRNKKLSLKTNVLSKLDYGIIRSKIRDYLNSSFTEDDVDIGDDEWEARKYYQSPFYYLRANVGNDDTFLHSIAYALNKQVEIDGDMLSYQDINISNIKKKEDFIRVYRKELSDKFTKALWSECFPIIRYKSKDRKVFTYENYKKELQKLNFSNNDILPISMIINHNIFIFKDDTDIIQPYLGCMYVKERPTILLYEKQNGDYCPIIIFIKKGVRGWNGEEGPFTVIPNSSGQSGGIRCRKDEEAKSKKERCIARDGWSKGRSVQCTCKRTKEDLLNRYCHTHYKQFEKGVELGFINGGICAWTGIITKKNVPKWVGGVLRFGNFCNLKGVPVQFPWIWFKSKGKEWREPRWNGIPREKLYKGTPLPEGWAPEEGPGSVYYVDITKDTTTSIDVHDDIDVQDDIDDRRGSDSGSDDDSGSRGGSDSGSGGSDDSSSDGDGGSDDDSGGSDGVSDDDDEDITPQIKKSLFKIVDTVKEKYETKSWDISTPKELLFKNWGPEFDEFKNEIGQGENVDPPNYKTGFCDEEAKYKIYNDNKFYTICSPNDVDGKGRVFTEAKSSVITPAHAPQPSYPLKKTIQITEKDIDVPLKGFTIHKDQESRKYILGKTNNIYKVDGGGVKDELVGLLLTNVDSGSEDIQVVNIQWIEGYNPFDSSTSVEGPVDDTSELYVEGGSGPGDY